MSDGDSEPENGHPSTWADLFARGDAVGTSESEVRESLRSHRDA